MSNIFVIINVYLFITEVQQVVDIFFYKKKIVMTMKLASD